MRGKTVPKVTLLQKYPKMWETGPNPKGFGFHIRQAGSIIEELSSKNVCTRTWLKLVEREKLKINGEGKKS